MAYADKAENNRYKNQWQKDNKDRIVLLPDKADGELLRRISKEAGKTPTQYVIDLIKQKELP